MTTATVDVMIVRISQATSVTGEKFALQCSVLGAGDFLTQIEWLNSERMRINTSNSFSVQLRFSPLQASHNGIYTCKATVEDVVLEKNYTVYVKRKFLALALRTAISFLCFKSI